MGGDGGGTAAAGPSYVSTAVSSAAPVGAGVGAPGPAGAKGAGEARHTEKAFCDLVLGSLLTQPEAAAVLAELAWQVGGRVAWRLGGVDAGGALGVGGWLPWA